jgi:hypothetical protein
MKALALTALFLSLSAVAFASDCYILLHCRRQHGQRNVYQCNQPLPYLQLCQQPGIGKSSEPGSVVADEVT